MSFDTGIPNIRVVIREAVNENLTVDVPNVAVNIQPGSQYNVNIIPNTVKTLRTGSFNTYADFAGFAYSANATNAVSASYALTASYVSGAASDWNTLANKPDGIVSSSVQVSNYNIFATTGSNTFIGNQSVTGTISVTGGVTASLLGTASWADRATTASFALNAGAGAGFPFSGSAVITGSLLVSSSGITVLGTGVTASLFGTSSWATNAISSSFSTTSSFSVSSSRAVTSSFAVTSSYALNTDLLDGLDSTVFATTGSNTFRGTQLVSGSIEVALGSGYRGRLISSSNSLIIANSNSGNHIEIAGTNTTNFFQVGTFSNGLNVTPGTNSTTLGLRVTTGSYPAATLLQVGTDTLIVTGSNVGIGTTTPIAPLTVVAGGNFQVLISGSAPAAYSQLYFDGTGRDFGIGVGNASETANNVANKFFLFDGTAPAIRLVVDTNGNLGVGTTTPVNRLQVAGNVSASSYTSSIQNAVGFLGTASYAINADLLDGLNSTVFATTGSNTFSGIQSISDTTNSTLWSNGALTVAGGVGIGRDVNISGSLTILGLLTAVSQSVQYVTSSQLIVTDNKIIVNVTDLQRFGGLSVIDSGSTSPTTASIYWDSLNHNFIYENLSGSAYNSALFIAGPVNTGALGNEQGLTVNRVPVASGTDHIDSRPASSSIRVDFPSRLTHVEAGLVVTGSMTAQGGLTGSLLGTSSWAQSASVAISASFASIGPGTANSIALFNSSTTVSSSNIFQSSNNIGIGISSPENLLHISRDGGAATIRLLRIDNSNVTNAQNLYLEMNTNKDVLWSQGSANGGTFWNTGNRGYGFSINATRSVTIDQVGRVGIGTQTPTTTLHVTASTGGLLKLDGLNSANTLYVSSSGDVGINTGTPQTKLEVRGGLGLGPSVDSIPTMDGGSFIGSTSGSGVYPFNEFGNLILASRTNGTGRDIVFYTGTTLANRMVIDRTGNVGIGTTTPSIRLQVSGSAVIDGTLNIYDSGSNNFPLSIGYNNRAASQYIRVNSTASTERGIAFSTAGNLRWIAYANSSTESTGDAGSNFAISAYNDAGTVIDTPFSIVRAASGVITLNRNVRILTGSSGAPVISPTTDTNTGIYFPAPDNIAFVEGGSEAMRIDSSANVGIGTTSPVNKLQIQGNVSASSYTSSINNAVGFFGTSSWAASASVASGFSGTANRVLYNNASNVTTTSANLTFDGTNLTVGGQLNAATKSFLINHRTKPGKKLVYGVAEGPEHSVFVRGRLTGTNTIVLPNEWEWLVDLESITVQLTAIGKPQKLFVKSIDRLYITVENGGFFSGPIDCYYFIQATRKDVDPLQTVV